MQFHIPNMTCFGCARSVTNAIQSVDNGAVIKADPENRTIEVETTAARAQIEAVLAEAGYPATRGGAWPGQVMPRERQTGTDGHSPGHAAN